MDNTKTSLQSEVADALWMVLRECEDKCDLELEDVSSQHVVWQLANIAIGFIRKEATPCSVGSGEVALVERLKREAQFHAQEARTANSTIAEIYRVVSGGTGEPGNWHGAEPVRKCIEELRAAIAAATEGAEG